MPTSHRAIGAVTAAVSVMLALSACGVNGAGESGAPPADVPAATGVSPAPGTAPTSSHAAVTAPSTGPEPRGTAPIWTATMAAPSPTAPGYPSVVNGSTPGTPAVPPRASAAPASGPGLAGGFSVTAADRSAATAIVARLSTAEKAASVIMPDSGTVAGTDLLSQHHFGGVIVMATNGVVDGTSGGTPAEVATLTANLQGQASTDPTGAPLLIGTDQEYGDVTRLRYGFTAFPGASELAAIPDTDRAVTMAHDVAAAAAQEMLAVGVTLDFAPVSDVLPTDGAGSAIGNRSYGSDPARAARLVAAAVTGYQAGGVPAALKHFPGLGRVATDTHTALPSLRFDCASWNAHEAVPIRAGIDAGVAMVMTGHVLLPAVDRSGVPASISAPIVSGLLRGSGGGRCTGMRFRGVTVTDSLQMEPIANHYGSGQAAVLALNSGEDLLLMPVDPAAAVHGIVAAVSSGELSASRLDAAATAVLALRLATARVPRPPIGVVGSAPHERLAARARAAAQR